MSGHSKWSTIKRQKAVTDARRSASFTKHARLITVAARTGGGDPNMNFRLRLAIDKARAGNMPNDNIDRAIKAGTGELRSDAVKELVYEGFGPGGVAMIVEAVTDNPNRTAGDIRAAFSKAGGTLGSQNSVLWMFEQRGVIRLPLANLPSPDEFLLQAIDADAEDSRADQDHLTLFCAPEKLPQLRDWVVAQNQRLDEATVELVPKSPVTVNDPQPLYALLDVLDEHPDVISVVTNEA